MDDPNTSNWKLAQVAELIAEAHGVVKGPVSALPQPHRNIIDGSPLASVAEDKRLYDIDYDHPVFRENHDQLCPGAWEKMEEFHASLNVDILAIDERLLHAYSAESVGSRAFQLRLIEMVAVAVHELAVLLHKLGDLKQHEHWKSWKPPNRHIPGPNYSRDPKPYPTLFVHLHFREHAQYPEGVADMVGYWAENRTFGGVVLFDRGESGNQCREVFFHSDRKDVTDRIYALTEQQKQNLSALLTNSSGQQSEALPIIGNSGNRVRVNLEDAVFMFHVYGDRWEREVLDFRQYPRRCKVIALDYPEMEDKDRH